MKNVLIGLFVVLVILQFFKVDIPNTKTNKNLEIKAPKKIMEIFKRSCYDCHSNTVKLPWYNNISPINYFIYEHVNLGRKYLNFSIWQTYTKEQKDKKLKGIYRTVYKAMPLPSYTWIHKDAILSKEEIKLIRDWTGKAPF